MIKYTTGFVDKLEDILEESKYTVRYERGNFQSGWCLLDHKRVVVLNKFLNTEGRVNTLVELIPQLKIDYDKLTLNSQKLFDFLTENRLEKLGVDLEVEIDPTAEEQQTTEADQDQELPTDGSGEESVVNDHVDGHEAEADKAEDEAEDAAEDEDKEDEGMHEGKSAEQ